jgi:hypothetical protein
MPAGRRMQLIRAPKAISGSAGSFSSSSSLDLPISNQGVHRLSSVSPTSPRGGGSSGSSPIPSLQRGGVSYRSSSTTTTSSTSGRCSLSSVDSIEDSLSLALSEGEDMRREGEQKVFRSCHSPASNPKSLDLPNDNEQGKLSSQRKHSSFQ